jgi:hypothetical protein
MSQSPSHEFKPRLPDEETLAVSAELKETTLVTQPPRSIWAKALIVICLGSSLFFDIFNAASAISALPEVSGSLEFAM